jgi:DNA-binding MarR family transcriptional regulator
MSKDRLSRAALVRSVTDAIRANSDQVDRLDEAAAARFRLNRTDARALEMLTRAGPLPARKFAEELGMTPGGVTTVIDRLERAGYARRRHDTDDRRQVLVEATELTSSLAQEVFGELIRQTSHLVDSYGDDELAVIKDFLERSRVVLSAHSDRLEGRRTGPTKGHDR